MYLKKLKLEKKNIKNVLFINFYVCLCRLKPPIFQPSENINEKITVMPNVNKYFCNDNKRIRLLPLMYL